MNRAVALFAFLAVLSAYAAWCWWKVGSFPRLQRILFRNPNTRVRLHLTNTDVYLGEAELLHPRVICKGWIGIRRVNFEEDTSAGDYSYDRSKRSKGHGAWKKLAHKKQVVRLDEMFNVVTELLWPEFSSQTFRGEVMGAPLVTINIQAPPRKASA